MDQKERRIKRTRAKIHGTAERPRLTVFRSAKHIYGQLIDDEKGMTLVYAQDSEIKDEKNVSEAVGKLIAKKAQEKNIKKAVFDRRGYQYHGRIKDLAQGARDGGLEI